MGISIAYVISIALMIFGFGFVVFFHELGHFLAAKWVGIKIEQFAIGFGHAVCSWRKGMGFTWGSSGKKLAAMSKEEQARYSETEYRFNWIPLGGYVKMLGQDDMNPNAQSDDPRSFNRKSIPQRMLVVSAGVIMNVILAAIGFMVVFLIGFRVPPPLVGSVQVESPAQKAGIRIGDRIRYLDDKYIYDFNKLALTAALVHADNPVPVVVERDGKQIMLQITPQKPDSSSRAFLMLGVGPMSDLAGPDPKLVKELKNADGSPIDPATQLLPGDVVTQVSGQPVTPNDYLLFDRVLQESYGKPIALQVRSSTGATRDVQAKTVFGSFFGDVPLNVAGMQPLTEVLEVPETSAVKGKIREGDVIEGLIVAGDKDHALRFPSQDQFTKAIKEAGKNGQPVNIQVMRGSDHLWFNDVVPNVKIDRHARGIGVGLTASLHTPFVASVRENSAAAKAKIPAHATIVSINDQPVAGWADVHRLLSQSGDSAKLAVKQEDGQVVMLTMALDKTDHEELADIRYVSDLALREHIEDRKTSSPLVAAAWGVTETRDLLLEFYVTLQRLAQGSVPASNLMGPIGIVHAGSLFAQRGADWLVWFLAMISANLAVVNFLPIPIVDGGLFMFLIIEKIQGKPLSSRMQTIAQVVGLALILCVFVLVTYNDITGLL